MYSRGSACVQCRSRKMVSAAFHETHGTVIDVHMQRCSGTRPGCAHCIRRREDCIYDGAKPSFKSEGLDPSESVSMPSIPCRELTDTVQMVAIS